MFKFVLNQIRWIYCNNHVMAPNNYGITEFYQFLRSGKVRETFPKIEEEATVCKNWKNFLVFAFFALPSLRGHMI